MTKHNLGATIRNDMASFRSGGVEAIVPRVEIPLPLSDADNITSKPKPIGDKPSKMSRCSYGIFSVNPCGFHQA